MVDIFTPGMCILLVGTALGFPIGFITHGFYLRHYLKKHMKEHPQYEMYLDLIEKK